MAMDPLTLGVAVAVGVAVGNLVALLAYSAIARWLRW